MVEEINWRVLKHSCCSITEEQFWRAVNIWKQNTHVVNRRVSSIVEVYYIKHRDIDYQQIESLISNCHKSANIFPKIDNSIVKQIASNREKNSCTGSVEISIRKVLPRNSDHFHECQELVLFVQASNEATFINLSEHSNQGVLPHFPYRIALKSSKIIVEVLSQQEHSDTSQLWLCSQLLPRLEKWAVNAHTSPNKAGNEVISQSLSLVNKEKYNTLYQNLKKKYGQEMVKIWPECTDPAKFVYEDVAIATYLLLLWEEEKQENCSFVDLGCGNGLLVHILNSEGHRGVGLDVRERKIWSLYPSTTKLKVETIIPSQQTLFPSANWLIGNHSDELTPWIPVMAARSSLKTRYFVLPCCPYEFDGRKFNRRKASQSQYNAYLQYIQKISEDCGFRTSVDRLRIPSTKRICLVGRERTYSEDEWSTINENIKEVIQRGCVSDSTNSNQNENEWVANFKPREKEEKVRNCTKIDRDLQHCIVTEVVTKLLSTSRLVDSQREPNAKWNAGGTLPIGEIVKLVTAEQLKRLKNECGGLQTLLRNHHQIFKVETGQVQLRLPQPKDDVTTKSKKPRIGTKPCWFYLNHPDGCLLSDDLCSFCH